MRTLVAASLIAVLILVLPAAASEREPAGEQLQSVSGTIALPTPARNVTRHIRSLGIVSDQTNGVVGWMFNVDRGSWGGEFSLTTTDPDADFDILFYENVGDLVGNGPSTPGAYTTVAKGGERGIIPPGTIKAAVYLGEGAAAPFKYSGHAIPTITIGSDALDVSVLPGATVRWVNGTDDYAFVRGERDFNSGEGQGRGIPVGGSFRYEFFDAGTYAYATTAGTGTVTVIEG